MNEPRAILEGARLLRLHLKATGQSVPTFCEKHDLNRIQVQRYLRGERHHAPVDFAEAIEKATNGEVPWRSWHSRTLRVDGPDLAPTGTG